MKIELESISYTRIFSSHFIGPFEEEGVSSEGDGHHVVRVDLLLGDVEVTLTRGAVCVCVRVCVYVWLMKIIKITLVFK